MGVKGVSLDDLQHFGFHGFWALFQSLVFSLIPGKHGITLDSCAGTKSKE